ncbi:MAG: DUF3108 domain-containing protein [Alphaproteobacteria bacterium]|nr:DUF3108 domain-containing protein [Alphaproteobacteria bacterium]
MKRLLLCFFMVAFLPISAQAVEVTHHLASSIAFLDAAEETFTYKFYNNRDYDIKTSVVTTNTFGALYPFKATYHSVGTYNKNVFKPQSYFQTSESRFHNRSKEIVYADGVPQYRISIKDDYKRQDETPIDSKYASSNDLLSTFAALTEQIIRQNKCDFEQYSFNGKRYSLSKVKTVGKEKIKTPYFEGKALKCQYQLEVLDDADAGFMLQKDEPIYFWVLRDKQTDLPFIARILVESTPFGELEALTTKIEVKK